MIDWMKWVHESRLEASPGFLINRTALRIKKELLHLLHTRKLDVTPEQCVVLWQLWNFEGGVQRELASTTFKDMTNLTRILDGMERRTLIVRKRDEHDRRCRRIFLTDKGRALQGDVLNALGELAARAYKGLSDKQVEQIKVVMDHIHSNLDGVPDDAVGKQNKSSKKKKPLA